MSFQAIISDVLTDYERNEGVRSREVKLLDKLCEDYSWLDSEVLYGLCMMYLLYYNSHKCISEYTDETSAYNSFVSGLPSDTQELWNCANKFRWYPDVWTQVMGLSSDIFMAVKDVYIDGLDFDESVNEKLLELKGLRGALEVATYKYGNSRSVLAAFDYEVSECQLDIDFMLGNSFAKSDRLTGYLSEFSDDIEA